jgi:hypothetical protein
MRASCRLATGLLLVCLAVYKIATFEIYRQTHNLVGVSSVGQSTETIASPDALPSFSWRTHNSAPDVCHILPVSLQHTTPLTLWTQYLDHIHNASQLLPQDPKYEYHDLTAQLLHMISPRLPNSIKAVPRDWSSVQHVLDKVLWPRWKYIIHRATNSSTEEQPVNQPPRPVKILVMGGSVVSGMNCLQVFSTKVKHKISREQCAWPHRLQQFLDQMVVSILQRGRSDVDTGNDHIDNFRLFQVHTVVMGGANTVHTAALSGLPVSRLKLTPTHIPVCR